MATLYLKSAGGNASAAATWSNTGSGGSDNSGPPGAGDDVILEAGSGAMTVDATLLCRSFDCTSGTGNYNNTVTLTPGFGLTIGTSTPGPGNVAFKLSTTTTLVFGSQTACPITCTSTSSTQQTITFAGKTTGDFIISGVGGSFLLADVSTLFPVAFFIVQAGTIDTNDLTHSWGFFLVSTTNAKTVNLGTSTINLTNATVSTQWNCASNTNLTMNASNSTIAFSVVYSLTRAFDGGGKTYGTLNYTVPNSGGVLSLSGTNSANTVIGTLNVGSGRGLTIGSNVTINTWNVNGVSNGYLYLPGSGANYASTPDSAAISITGDMEVQIRVNLPTMEQASSGIFVSKWSGLTGGNGFEWDTIATGFAYKDSVDGTIVSYNNSIASAAQIAAAGLTGGTTYWLRLTVEVNNGGKRKISMFWAADNATPPTSWTLVGTPLASVAAAPSPDTNSDLEIGAAQAGAVAPLIGNVYRCRILNGLAGTVVLDADFTTKAFGANSFTESSSNAATVSINGTAGQNGDGRVELVGTGATVTVPSLVDCDYLCSTGFTGANRTPFYFGSHSVDRGSNVNVVFRARPAPLPSAALFSAGD